jgi:KDO2-lipid IV(A) lauroyltransferase
MRVNWISYWIIDPFWGAMDNLTHLLLRCLPLKTASAVGAWLGSLAKHRFTAAQADILANLAFLDPQIKQPDQARIADALWKNIGRTLTEMAVLDRFRPQHYVFTDVNGIFDRLDRQRPVIFLFPHLGNWELIAHHVTRAGFRLNIIYEFLPNRFQRRLVARARKRTVYELISPDYRGTRQLFRNLAAGQAAGIAMDEFRNSRIVAPVFQGELPEKSNIRYAIGLARRFGAPLVTGYCLRKKGVSFEIVCADMYDTTAMTSSDDEIAGLINERCQQWIRRHPEQWYMLHRARLKR